MAQAKAREAYPASDIEEAACPLCGGERAQGTRYASGPFRVKRCLDCQLWYLSPRLTAAATEKLYAANDYFGAGQAGYADYRQQEQSLRLTFRRLLARLKRKGATSGALLEVGCGPGYLLDEARTFFSQRTGIEPSPGARQEAARLTGARLHASLDEAAASGPFDLVLATHVIEHILAPVPFAQKLTGLLRPGGYLVLAAPDMGSFFRKTMGRRWPSFKYPEHVSFFDQATLRQLFLSAGLSEVERLSYPHAFPLSLILRKLGLPALPGSQHLSVLLPATTVCFIGRRPTGGA